MRALTRTALGRASLALMGVFATGGCNALLSASTADLAGVAGGGISRAVTNNAAITTGIGLGVAAGARAGLDYAQRVVHRAEQDRIAEAAGPLAEGAVGHWRVVHDIPIENNEHGDLVVVRLLGGQDFTCKEIVFSVDTNARDKPQRAFYLATVCRDGEVWKWASAEPATERWGSLQ